jgi:hypothetical protein
LVNAASILATLLVSGSPAAGQQAVEAASTTIDNAEPWHFRAATYGWLMSVGGTVTAKGHVVDVNASFIDLVQKSDSVIGYMGYFEANKGQVGFFADAVFVRLGFSSSALNYRNPVASLKVSTAANAGLTYSMTVIEAAGTYQLHRWLGATGAATALDALAGIRVWNQAVDLRLDVVGVADVSRLGLQRGIGFSTASSGNFTWVDPVIGLRLRHQFTPSHDIVLLGDIGGFGLQSNFTWQVFAGYNAVWQFTGYQVAAVIGFRALGIDHSSSAGSTVNSVNMVFYGPILGGSVRF